MKSQVTEAHAALAIKILPNDIGAPVIAWAAEKIAEHDAELLARAEAAEAACEALLDELALMRENNKLDRLLQSPNDDAIMT